MSHKNARTLTQPSNREKVKDGHEKKVVFKGVLTSPYRIQWPSVPINLQNTILDYVVRSLEGSADYRALRCAASRKRKRVVETVADSKKQKIDASNIQGDPTETTYLPASETTGDTVPALNLSLNVDQNLDFVLEPPVMLRHLLCGINEVTKRLEIQSQEARRHLIIVSPEPVARPKPLKYIFVCRADVNPTLLIDHLPHLVAAYNSSHPIESVKLVTLPRGSEVVIAKKLGIRRITVLGIDTEYPEDLQLTSMLNQVTNITAPWLSKTTSASSLVATHVKHTRTTAPKDMKLAKDSRTQQKSKKKLLKRLTID